MPPLRNIDELRRAAQGNSFLRNGTAQYETVRNFTQKLLDLRDILDRIPEESYMTRQLNKFTGDLTTLQMHDAPFVDEDRLSTAISDIVVDLPYFLDRKQNTEGGKSGYESLAEAGEKYGLFTRGELDEALNTVSRGMDMDVRFGEAARQQQAAGAQPEAEAVPEPEVQDEGPVEIQYTDEWYRAHRNAIGQNQTEYRAQRETLDGPMENDEYAVNFAAGSIAYNLRDLGVLKTGLEEFPPQRKGAPSVFIVKDGKISTLEEAGLWICRKVGGETKHNPEIARAAMRGELFSYLPGGGCDPLTAQAAITLVN